MSAEVDLAQLGMREVPLAAPDLFPGDDRAQLTFWMSGTGIRVLREASKDTGLAQSEIARRGLAMWLATWQADRRRKLALLHGLTDAQIGQAKQIFSHVPDAEFPAGVLVHFDVNANGDVVLVVDSTGVHYALFKEFACAVKMEVKDATHSHLTVFRRKQIVEEGDYPLKREVTP